jgi:hypothetical protein
LFQVSFKKYQLSLHFALHWTCVAYQEWYCSYAIN